MLPSVDEWSGEPAESSGDDSREDGKFGDPGANGPAVSSRILAGSGTDAF